MRQENNMDNSTIGILFAVGVCFFILYTRKKKWMSRKLVWFICIGFLAIGLFGFLYLKPIFRGDKVLYFGFCIPIVYWIVDRIFKRLSEKIHQRDFILFLRNSDEIDDGFGASNPHVKSSDKLFSIGLVIIIVLTLVIGLVII